MLFIINLIIVLLYGYFVKSFYKGKIDEEIRKNKIYRNALEEIVNKQGKVCEEFELCKHESCRSSVNSWFIANIALKRFESMIYSKMVK